MRGRSFLNQLASQFTAVAHATWNGITIEIGNYDISFGLKHGANRALKLSNAVLFGITAVASFIPFSQQDTICLEAKEGPTEMYALSNDKSFRGIFCDWYLGKNGTSDSNGALAESSALADALIEVFSICSSDHLTNYYGFLPPSSVDFNTQITPFKACENGLWGPLSLYTTADNPTLAVPDLAFFANCTQTILGLYEHCNGLFDIPHHKPGFDYTGTLLTAISIGFGAGAIIGMLITCKAMKSCMAPLEERNRQRAHRNRFLPPPAPVSPQGEPPQAAIAQQEEGVRSPRSLGYQRLA